ncbi:MAG: alpha/beta hydrolase [Proteobacteria bacterium]|nr:alpha/beta hydrolase [Pseudomonadota bacterium]
MTERTDGHREMAPSAFLTANFFAWPFIAAAAAGDALAVQAGEMARVLSWSPADSRRPTRLDWTSPNRVRLELSTMDLRDFSSADAAGAKDVPVLVCAPFALHCATIADLAPGHSLVEILAAGGRRLFLTDWHSATGDMRLLTIDTYLAELNVAVDEIGAPVDLVGLCQGGWMALVYAARFPGKVRKLVLAGAPVDVDAGTSRFTIAAQYLPFGVFDELTRLGDGRLQGRRAVEMWEPALHGDEVAKALQVAPGELDRQPTLRDRFAIWSDSTLDLPGAFYRQCVLWLFKENRLAQGRFVALGRPVDLTDVRHPLFLLAAHDDQVVPPEQLMAARHLVGSRPQDIESAIEPGGHLSLFVGTEILHGAWARVARWLDEPPVIASIAA